jgi:hypothetical protein
MISFIKLNLRIAMTSIFFILFSLSPSYAQGIYEEAYDFAYSSDGMNLDQYDAQLVADQIAAMRNPATAFYCYRDAYTYYIYTYSNGRGNLDRNEAIGYAEDQCIYNRSGARGLSRRNEVFQEAFTFAKSSSGMNLDRSEAQEIAREVAATRNPVIVLSCFKDAYTFAKSGSGMNLDRGEAVEHVKDLCINNRRGARGLSRRNEVFQKAFTFAKSSSGMNLDRSEAQEIAREVAATRNPVMVLSCFKDAYTFAHSSSGMNLDRDEAIEHTRNQCGIVDDRL